MVRANPWALITLIFASQTIGAAVIAQQFRIGFWEVAIPIHLLLLGTVVSALFRVFHSGAGVGSWKCWFPAVVYALFIFFLSNRSYPDAQISFDTSLLHPLEYMTLGIFFCWIWRDVPREKGMVAFLIRVLAAGAIWGISDEIHQTFIPGRTGEFFDVVLDSLGAGAGCGLFLIYRYFQKLVGEYPGISPQRIS